jgi:Xaa-Pro aminopeptidase
MKRIKQLEKILKENGLDGLLIVNDANIRYLTGFTSSESFAVLSPGGRAFITDSRYTEQAEREVVNFEIVKWRSPNAGLHETIKAISDRFGIKKLGFEKKYVTMEMYEKLENMLVGIELIGTAGLVEQVRRIKDDQEIEYMRKAACFADKAFTEILNYVKVGITEKDLERELQYITKIMGADDIGFPAIIASGKNSSMPHAVPSEKLIEDGDFITFDMGALYKGYRSDMTRTIVVGHATDRQREVYELVKSSQEESLKMIKSGVDGKIPHLKAREVMEKTGIEGIFEYGVGHGVGLDIHEDPFMSPRCELTLEEGNVVTIEPGIYIPGWGGIRIEDTVVVTNDGCEILTLSPKELIIV